MALCHLSLCLEFTIRFDIRLFRRSIYRHTHRGRTDTRQPNPCDNARRRHRHRGERNQQCKVETAQEKYIPYRKTNEMTITFRQNSAKFSPNWHQLFWRIFSKFSFILYRFAQLFSCQMFFSWRPSICHRYQQTMESTMDSGRTSTYRHTHRHVT